MAVCVCGIATPASLTAEVPWTAARLRKMVLFVVQIETCPPEQRIGAAAELRDHLGGKRGRQEPSPASRLPRRPCPTQDPVEIGRTADRHQSAEFDKLARPDLVRQVNHRHT